MPDAAVVQIVNGQFAQNCYLVADPAAERAVMVDPGEEWERVLSELERRRWTLTAIWLTHAHIDHVWGVGPVHAATGAKIWLHPADRPLYERVPDQAAWLGLAVPELPPPHHALVAHQQLRVGDLEFTVRHTPGHTPGSVSLVGEGVVFTGDALFAGSIGRTDLPGGDLATLLASIRRELLPLPDQTIVYSGHGPATTIGHERDTNPFL